MDRQRQPLKTGEVAIRQILAKREHQDPHDDMEHPRDEEGNAPGSEGRSTNPPNDVVKGMRSCVAPPPIFPHPAAFPFAGPMILPLNMVLIQSADDTSDMQKTVGVDGMMRKAQP